MKVKEIIFEDFVNYKHPSMFIGVCSCDWKCCKENPDCKCQNASIANYPVIDIKDSDLIDRYLKNGWTHAVVIGGLEPMLQFDELEQFISAFRERSNDDVVIYTGYYPEEVQGKIDRLKRFSNIIVKFGRYKPGKSPHLDAVLGVELANPEQFAEKIS